MDKDNSRFDLHLNVGPERFKVYEFNFCSVLR